jgi:two-component sensor histidine kinase
MRQFDQKSAPEYNQRLGVWLYIDELMHRTLNDYTCMLSIVQQASLSVSGGDKDSALDEVIDRLRASAATFSALRPPMNFSSRSLDLAIADLCDAISKSVLTRGLTLCFHSQPITISSRRCWQISLIVAELITNAVRHAFNDNRCGTIKVDVRLYDTKIYCSVTDDGISNAVVSPGRGTSIVDALASELGGTIVRGFSSTGSVVKLLVPAYDMSPDV